MLLLQPRPHLMKYTVHRNFISLQHTVMFYSLHHVKEISTSKSPLLLWSDLVLFYSVCKMVAILCERSASSQISERKWNAHGFNSHVKQHSVLLLHKQTSHDFCLLVKMEACFFLSEKDERREFAPFPEEVWMSASESLASQFSRIWSEEVHLSEWVVTEFLRTHNSVNLSNKKLRVVLLKKNNQHFIHLELHLSSGNWFILYIYYF